MQAQIRIYTINKGELDNFIKHFKEETKPIHDKVGWPIASVLGQSAAERVHLDPDLRGRRRPGGEDEEALQGRRSRPRVSRSAPTSPRMEVREVEMA